MSIVAGLIANQVVMSNDSQSSPSNPISNPFYINPFNVESANSIPPHDATFTLNTNISSSD